MRAPYLWLKLMGSSKMLLLDRLVVPNSAMVGNLEAESFFTSLYLTSSDFPKEKLSYLSNPQNERNRNIAYILFAGKLHIKREWPLGTAASLLPACTDRI